MSTPRWRLAAVAFAIAFTSAVAGLAAHPTSTASVVMEARPAAALVVTISADAESLLAKLDAASAALGAAASATTGDPVDRLRRYGPQLTTKVEIVSNTGSVPLAFAGAVVGGDGRALVTLTGRPVGSGETLTFRTWLIFGAYPLSVRLGPHRDSVQWLQGDERSEPAAVAAAPLHTIARGVVLGFTHIVPAGLDHILFVAGLVLLGTRRRQIVAQVSAFTIAHSVTLGLSLYGLVSLPPRVVEPLIALSIAYVGLENMFARAVHARRLAVVFAFGLLHGLGFAEALQALHLSRPDRLVMLVSFNAGVEMGQLVVVGATAVLVLSVARGRTDRARLVTNYASAAVAAIGLVWTVQRLW